MYSGWSTAARFWTTYPCALLTTVSSDGQVAISHDTGIPGQESKVPLGTSGARLFDVEWAGGAFPAAAAGCGGVCAVAEEAEGGGGAASSCLCNVTVASAPVFNGSAVPSRAAVLGNLTIGAFDPALFDAGVYERCATARCNASAAPPSGGGVVVWLRRGGAPAPAPPTACRGDLRLESLSAGRLDGKAAGLAVAYGGVDAAFDDAWMGRSYNFVVGTARLAPPPPARPCL